MDDSKKLFIILRSLIIEITIVILSLSYSGKKNVMAMSNNRQKVAIPEAITTKAKISVTKKSLANINVKLFKYLSDVNNKENVNNVAISMNGGNPHNACVYFTSEALRRIGVNIFKGTCTTNGLINQLNRIGWIRHMDLSTLQPGDICFTTNESGNIIGGQPTHAFIFMSWANNKKTVMNVCDNQAYDYGTVLHTRPICKSMHNKVLKEATTFFYSSSE